MSLDWAARNGTVLAGGKLLEWSSYGSMHGDDPTVVLLHEGLGCVSLWRDFPSRLAEATGLSVFAYSRSGYGHSESAKLPRLTDYMTREATDVLPEVLNAVGARKYILLGHSDGATIAAEYAGRIQDARVRGLILMAPHFFSEEFGLIEIEKAKVAFETSDLKLRLGKYHRDAEATFRGWNDVWLSPSFRRWNVSDVIDYIRVPTLVLQGQQDQYGTILQVQEIEQRSYAPVEVRLLDHCRHSPHIEQPETTLKEIGAFVINLLRMENMKVEIA